MENLNHVDEVYHWLNLTFTQQTRDIFSVLF